jgi:hypothetical protein
MILSTKSALEDMYSRIAAGIPRGLYYKADYVPGSSEDRINEFVFRVGARESSLTSNEKGVERVAFVLSARGDVEVYVSRIKADTVSVDSVDEFIQYVLDNTRDVFVAPAESSVTIASVTDVGNTLAHEVVNP